LAPSENKSFVVRVQATRSGQQTHQALARIDGGRQLQSEAAVIVGGTASLTLQVTDRDDPLEVGKETIYEIRVHNQGTSADGNVKVEVYLPEGLLPRQVSGPTAGYIQGRQVTFTPLAKLGANEETIYRVSAQAMAPGDQRVRVQLTSDQVRQPVFREERTRVYRD